jgi:nucleoside-diphosphate-sugar epimerase
MKRILITGVTGFVGTSLVHYFHENKGVSIYGHSRDIQKAKTKFAAYKIEFLEELTVKAFDENNIDIIIHLAGIAHDLSGKFQENDYQHVNYTNTKELHEVFVNSKVSTFVFISSIKAVVDHTDCLIDENFVPNPASEYGKSKRKAEEFITNNARNDKKYFILRPCMIHGPGNKGNLNLLYRFVKAGIPYPLGAFKNKRSFLSIENFCFIMQKIIEEQLKPGTYLLSDDDPVSTNEVVRIIGRGLNKKVRILSLPKAMIWSLARIGSWTHAPFNTSIVAKLCENMVVSNQKLLLNLKAKLPISSIDGLKKTIKSFNE